MIEEKDTDLACGVHIANKTRSLTINDLIIQTKVN